MARSIASLVLSVVLVATCATAPSPSPGSSAATESTGPSGITSPKPSASPIAPPNPTPFPAATSTPPSEANGWPLTFNSERGFEPVFAPDGTVYLLTGGPDAQLVALDRAGHLMPGWPLEEPPGSDFGSPAAGPDGSAYLEECAGATVGCVVHRLDASGRDRSGWPVELTTAFACSNGGNCAPAGLYVGTDGTAFVSHWRDSGGLQILAIDPSGRIKPGWPVAPGASGGLWWTNVQLGADGTLFMYGIPDDGVQPDSSIAAFGPDGTLRAGWPVSVPDRSGYLLGPQGTIVVWSLIDDIGELCSNPRRTAFTILGPDGRTLPGWPRGSTGYASSPVVDPDGTLYYVSATARVYAHDKSGEVKAGWPVLVPGAWNGCGPQGPALAPDGTIYIVGDEIVALSPDGRTRPGWPYRPTGSLSGPCFDSECFDYRGGVSFGPDGTVYLVVYHGERGNVRAEIIAIDQQGQAKPGWPYPLPFDANTVPLVARGATPDGRLFVGAGYFSPFTLLALDPDGRLSR